MRLVLVLLLVVSTAACTGDDPGPEPTVNVFPSATPRHLQPGIQVKLTATVTGILNPNAFLVGDADLPAAGQVVVSDTPVDVRVTDLVTITGRTESFHPAAFDRYGVTDPRLYESSGGIVVIAASVRRYLPESPAPSASPPSGSPR